MAIENLKFKAIVLAAGEGKRLGLLTQDIPKPLLNINDKSILEHNLISMDNAKLFEKVIIVTGYMRYKLRNTTESISTKVNFEINEIFNPQYASKSVLYSVERGLDIVGPGNIILMNGDTLFSPAIFDKIRQKLQIEGIPKGSIVGSIKNKFNSDEILVRLDNLNIVVHVGKNLRQADAVSAGIILISNDLRTNYLDKLKNLQSSDKIAHHDIIDSLCKDGEPITFISVSPNNWAEIDTVEDYENAKRLFKEMSK